MRAVLLRAEGARCDGCWHDRADIYTRPEMLERMLGFLRRLGTHTR